MESDILYYQLPTGWVETKLDNISEIILGQSPPSSTYNEDEKGLPFYQGKLEFGDTYPTPQKWCSLPKKIAEKGDILISVRAPVGPTNICPEKSCIGRGLAAIHGKAGISSLFLLYLLRSLEYKIAGEGTGTTFNAITGNQLRGVQVPLPPLPEQHRIVEKIEELFTKLDAGVESLKKAKEQMRHYRLAVLKYAFEGKLTEEWRKANKDKIEPASVLLERIKDERKRKLGSKYKELLPVDTSEFHDLPDGWVWTSLEQLSWDSGYGTSVKCDYSLSGSPVLRIPNIVKGRIDLNDLKNASASDKLNANESLNYGDLLVVRTNGSKDLIGRAALVTQQFERPCFFASYLIRFRVIDIGCLPIWLITLWHSMRMRRWIERMAATSAGQYNVSMTSLNKLVIELPPIAEQYRIIEEIELRLSVADEVENVIDTELKRAERLRQSILKQAFSGKLVPQDPTDEPASVLLERIRAEKEKHSAKNIKNSNRKSKKEPKQMRLFENGK